MQCIWQSFARRSLSAVTSRSQPFAFNKTANLFRTRPNFREITTYDVHRTFNAATSPLPTPQPPVYFLDIPTTHATSRSPQYECPSRLPPSRVALSAARSVRESLKQESLEDAFFIVNSICYSYLSADPSKAHIVKSYASSVFKKTFAPFPLGVSPRLPAHSLLHGLIKIGMPQQASAFATALMNTGIPVRGKTLEAIISSLAKASSLKKIVTDTELKRRMQRLANTPRVVTLNPSMAANEETAFALELLQAARKSRSRRTGAMFNTLITLCLINGEIIIASLLFGLLTKDWEARSQVLARKALPAEEPSPSKQTQGYFSKRNWFRYYHFTKPLCPTPQMLNSILAPIEAQLKKPSPADMEAPEFQAALQALANVAVLLDKRLIPFSHLDRLIRMLSDCPVVDNTVWILDDTGKANNVKAHKYFHSVLGRLTNSLPRKLYQGQMIYRHFGKTETLKYTIPNGIRGMLPPLSRTTYNSLLHYALRHRYSFHMASSILKHMTEDRKPPLSPESDTFNIILRSASLLRRPDIASKALEAFNVALPEGETKSTNPLDFPRRLNHLATALFDLLAKNCQTRVKSDHFTLSSYLAHLISSGNPQSVIDIMHHSLPYLDKEMTESLPADDRQLVLVDSLKRAVLLQPHILGLFIHALNKHGDVYKAISLFDLIMKAERASHDPAFSGKVKPWSLSVVMYTTMLQVYEHEFKRWEKQKGERRVDLLLSRTSELYHHFKYSESSVPDIGHARKPDIKFYNAVLRNIAYCLPQKHTSLAASRGHFKHVHQRYAETGQTDDRGWHPLLDEVVSDMERDGYPIPVGFWSLFIGRRYVCFAEHKMALPDLAYAVSKGRRAPGPYTMPEYHSKGIPGRRSRRRRKKLEICNRK